MTYNQRPEPSEFFEKLASLGARTESLHTLRDAYEALLADPEPCVWDTEPLFDDGSRMIDHEKVRTALQELGQQDLARDFPAVMMRICQHIGMAAWEQGPGNPPKVVPGSHSLGAIVRCALFMAVAFRCGCSTTSFRELEDLVLAAAGCTE